MGSNTKIEWATHTFNPWRGCTRVSPACDNCYAETMSRRNHMVLGQWGDEGTRVVASEEMWQTPIKWEKQAWENQCFHSANRMHDPERPRVFCASLCDVFEDWRGPMIDSKGKKIRKTYDGKWLIGEGGILRNDFPLLMKDVRYRLYNLIEETVHMNWLLLTKRPENIYRMIPGKWLNDFPDNVWIGTTVENQEQADKRIPHLLKIPAKIRFLSCEPLLGEIDFSNISNRSDAVDQWGKKTLSGIHWVICGGESGSDARPMNPEWARSLRDQCNACGVPFFFKQWGEWVPEFHPSVCADGSFDRRKVEEDNSFVEFIRDENGKVEDYRGQHMFKIGKKKAGRELDGCEWNEAPGVKK